MGGLGFGIYFELCFLNFEFNVSVLPLPVQQGTVLTFRFSLFEGCEKYCAHKHIPSLKNGKQFLRVLHWPGRPFVNRFLRFTLRATRKNAVRGIFAFWFVFFWANKRK